jgi:hypothetical protein
MDSLLYTDEWSWPELRIKDVIHLCTNIFYVLSLLPVHVHTLDIVELLDSEWSRLCVSDIVQHQSEV